MTKEELVTKVSDDAGITKSQASKALKSIVDGIEDALKKGDKVSLVGFGTFCVSRREAREGRNPATGKPISIPAANIPKFKPGKKLKDSV
jgi:DNA-binding protein HU-beta